MSPWRTQGLRALDEWTGSPSNIWIGQMRKTDHGETRFVFKRFTTSRRIRTHLKSKPFELKPGKTSLQANYTLHYNIEPFERCILETQLRTEDDDITFNRGEVLKHTGSDENDAFSVTLHDWSVEQSHYCVVLSFSCYNQHSKSEDKIIEISDFSLAVL